MTEKPSTATSFEEWFDLQNVNGGGYTVYMLADLMRCAWNAALAARPSQQDAVDEYERVNLREACAAIMTSGPFASLNTGDWVGQIRWRLEKFKDALRPNATAEEMIARANDRLAASTVAPSLQESVEYWFAHATCLDCGCERIRHGACDGVYECNECDERPCSGGFSFVAPHDAEKKAESTNAK